MVGLRRGSRGHSAKDSLLSARHVGGRKESPSAITDRTPHEAWGVMSNDWIRLCRPTYSPEVENRVSDVLRSGHLVQGPQVEAFERMVASGLGAGHAIAVNSGTSALHLAFMAAGLGPADRVVMSDFTFPSPASVLELVGAEPVFVDIADGGYNMDLGLVEGIVKTRRDIKAVIAIHQFGECVDMPRLMHVARDYGLVVIEDAACAIGAGCNGQSAATFGRMACLSFHPRKIISTGEGGMIITNDPALAERLARLRNHGLARVSEDRLDVTEPGLNLRLSEIHAVLGLEQMKRLDAILARRREVADRYQERLKDVPGLKLPRMPWPGGHNFQSYVVQLPASVSRSNVMSHLRRHRIETTIGTYAVHALDYYRRRYGYSDDAFPRTTLAWRQCLSLPIGEHLSDADIDRVASVLVEAIDVR